MELVRNILICVGIFYSTSLSCQSSIGLFYGGTQYRGDLSEDKVGIFKNLRPTQGAVYHYKWNDKFSFYTSFMSTHLEAYDKELEDPALIQRNLHFRTSLKELAMGFEIYPLPFLVKKSLRINPYIKTGISMFLFNPKGLYDGKWRELQPLRTEGQGLPNSGKKPYSLFDVSYPFGLGVRIKLNSMLTMKVELAPRKTNTDYLDDVSGNYYDLDEIIKYSSITAAKLAYQEINWDINEVPPMVKGKQRGNSSLNDWYVVQQITFSYTFEKAVDPENMPTQPTLEEKIPEASSEPEKE